MIHGRRKASTPSPAIAASLVSAPGLVMETTEAKTTPRPNSSINPPPSPSMSCQSQLRTRASPTAIVPQLSQRPLRIACHLPATRPPLPSAWRPLRGLVPIPAVQKDQRPWTPGCPRPFRTRPRTWSVGRQTGVDLVDPGKDAPTDMHGVGEPGGLDSGQGLRRTHTGLAVKDDTLVLRQLLEGASVEELALRDELRPGDVDDLVLVLLPDVDEEDVVGLVVDELLELGRGDGGVCRGLGRLLRHRAAEGLVVDQLGDGFGLGVLADLDLTPAHLQGIEDEQPADERITDARDQFDGLVDHDRSDGCAQHPQDTALGAGGDHPGRRRLRVQVTVLG